MVYPTGTKLNLTMSLATGQQRFADMYRPKTRLWSTLGIHVSSAGSFTEVAGEAVPSNHELGDRQLRALDLRAGLLPDR